MKNHNFKLSVVDTDSIAFSKSDYSPFTKEELVKLTKELNDRMKEGIEWQYDGEFKSITAVGAKNYILCSSDNKIKIKGSALKASKKEPRLKKFIEDVCKAIAEDKENTIIDLYKECAKEILSINELSDAKQWSFKVTATESVFNRSTPFNKKVYDAIARHKIPLVEGDKYYLFFKEASGFNESTYVNKAGKIVKKKTKIQDLEITDKFNGDICQMTLLKKLFTTIKIFNRVLDISKYPNYTLKKNIIALGKLREEITKVS